MSNSTTSEYGESGEIILSEKSKLSKAIPHILGAIALMIAIFFLIFLIIISYFWKLEPNVFSDEWYHLGFIIGIVPSISNIVKSTIQMVIGRVQELHIVNALASLVSSIAFLILASIYPFTVDEYIVAISDIKPTDLNADTGIQTGLYVLAFLLLLDTISQIAKYINFEKKDESSLIR